MQRIKPSVCVEKMISDCFLLFTFTEEKLQVRQAILSCYLPGGAKEEFEDDLESEEDEEK